MYFSIKHSYPIFSLFIIVGIKSLSDVLTKFLEIYVHFKQKKYVDVSTIYFFRGCTNIGLCYF